MKNKKGFTIIELIVVVAIIAILAAIILINVTQYLNKSKDSAMKGDMHTLQTDLVATYGVGGDYTGACTNDPGLKDWTAVGKLQTNSALRACGTSSETTGGKLSFCACVQELAPTTDTYYCVDSLGTASESTSSSCLTNCAGGSTGKCPS